MKQRAITSGSMSASVTGAEIDVSTVDTYSVHFVWTGSPTGTVSVEASNNDGSNWSTVSLSSYPTGGTSGDFIFNTGALVGYEKIRPKYTRTSGTGTIDCWVAGKDRLV